MLGALLAMRALKSISKRMNPSRFNGASLLGLRGLVFKSHGSADAFAYECAIKRAYDAVKHDVLLRISSTMAELLPSKESQASVEAKQHHLSTENKHDYFTAKSLERAAICHRNASPTKTLVAKLAAKGVETSDEWIRERSGITSRHYVEDDVLASDLGVEAAKKALDMAKLDA